MSTHIHPPRRERSKDKGGGGPCMVHCRAAHSLARTGPRYPAGGGPAGEAGRRQRLCIQAEQQEVYLVGRGEGKHWESQAEEGNVLGHG